MFGESLTIRLAPRDLAALQRLATQEGVSVDHFIRGLVSREIKRAPDVETRNCADERPAGGGLALHRLTTGDRLCTSSEIGFAYSRLVKRFGAPMPGHPHTMRHLLGPAAPEEVDDDFDLIE